MDQSAESVRQKTDLVGRGHRHFLGQISLLHDLLRDGGQSQERFYQPADQDERNRDGDEEDHQSDRGHVPDRPGDVSLDVGDLHSNVHFTQAALLDRHHDVQVRPPLGDVER